MRGRWAGGGGHGRAGQSWVASAARRVVGSLRGGVGVELGLLGAGGVDKGLSPGKGDSTRWGHLSPPGLGQGRAQGQEGRHSQGGGSLWDGSLTALRTLGI